jgi:hypothetical protein
MVRKVLLAFLAALLMRIVDSHSVPGRPSPEGQTASQVAPPWQDFLNESDTPGPILCLTLAAGGTFDASCDDPGAASVGSLNESPSPVEARMMPSGAWGDAATQSQEAEFLSALQGAADAEGRGAPPEAEPSPSASQVDADAGQPAGLAVLSFPSRG